GYVKVLDFGLARLATDALGSGTTATGMIIGTVRYMSPEQGQGLTIATSSDVFSLGMVFYEMATGRHPFEAASPLATFQGIAEQSAAPPSRLNPEIPHALEELILAMLEKKPEARPEIQQIAAALLQVGAVGLRSVVSSPL